MSLLHTEGLVGVGEEEEEQVPSLYALVEKWREVEKECTALSAHIATSKKVYCPSLQYVLTFCTDSLQGKFSGWILDSTFAIYSITDYGTYF